MSNVSVTVQAGTCIGCGACAAVCRSNAIRISWTRESEYLPQINTTTCVACGRCHSVCPHTPAAIRAEAEQVCGSADPLRFGLEGAEAFLAWDTDADARKRSASGGAVTAILRRLFETGRIDAVLHAEPVAGAFGAPHVRAAISRSMAEVDSRRSSFYHPICYADALRELRSTATRVAVVGVPCVIRAVRALWEVDGRYRRIDLITVGLACSHNVNGQFIDFLARSAGLSRDVPFTADLRNKDRIPDANNFNTLFFVNGREVARSNRFRNLFTHAWRQHWFAMGACHTCADFWGYQADATVKDAWGRWAGDPLGKSILVVRDANLRALLESDSSIHLEPLAPGLVTHCQEATATYKQVRVLDRLDFPAWSRRNRASGYLRYRWASSLSKTLFSRAGYHATRLLLFGLLGRPTLLPDQGNVQKEPAARRRNRRLTRRLRRVLRRHPHTDVVCWGTGAMAEDVARALPCQISSVVDGEPTRRGTSFFGRSVRPPSALEGEHARPVLLLIASMHDDAIRRQVATLAISVPLAVVSVAPIHAWACKRPWFGLRPRKAPAKKPPVTRRRPRRERKILVVGGFGYRNAGDEAQLQSTLGELASRFPDHLIKVLTPNPHRTHLTHDGCAVGEAPRLAFFDSDQSPLYALDSRIKKLVFLARAWWLLLHARLVHAGVPFAVIGARRLALLYDIATADLVFFSGGGYLTGKTLSRLWDGLALMRIAHALGTPCALSGQTVGIWDDPLSARLARDSFNRTAVIATRDADKSRAALRGLHLSHPRVLSTCDDALFLETRESPGLVSSAFKASDIAPHTAALPYVVLNAHYWGLESDDDRSGLLARLVGIVDRLQAAGGLVVVGLPMVPSDADTLLAIERARPDGRFRMLRYDGDFRVARAVIRGSRVCVSMKHHPIIFALGERVPTISLSLGEYYEHKNLGALGLVGLADFNVRMDDARCLERFGSLYRRVEAERVEIVGQIERALPPLAARRAAFYDGVETVVSARQRNVS
jgi:coenzyme F420-reducing hydrogenase beta subunit/polysaccharide pyruvyl transferase WcaK-like protein